MSGNAYEIAPEVWLHARSQARNELYGSKIRMPFLAIAAINEIAWTGRGDAACLLRASRAKLKRERWNA